MKTYYVDRGPNHQVVVYRDADLEVPIDPDHDPEGIYTFLRSDTFDANDFRAGVDSGRLELPREIHVDLEHLQDTLVDHEATLEVHLSPKQSYAILVALCAADQDTLVDLGVFPSFQRAIEMFRLPQHARLSEGFKEELYAHFTKPSEPSDGPF